MTNKFFPEEQITENDLYFFMLYDRTCSKEITSEKQICC